MRVVAVPVKSPERSKTRLARVLGPDERAILTLAMMEDVLLACLAQPGWQTWVVSRSPKALDLARRSGARPVVEEGRSLLAAVRQVERAAGPAGELAVVLADLPLITPEALREVLAFPEAVVAAPARSDGGTNVLVRRPPSAIAARFGLSSFRRHRAGAYRSGLGFREAAVPELGFDLDRPADLVDLLDSRRLSRTGSVCRRLRLAERLRMGA
jgi:2-phospho-L-lactate guanylyltransferase